MTPPNNLGEQLEEILIKLSSTIELNTFARINNEGTITGAMASKKMLDSMVEAKQTILRAIAEIVPEEKYQPQFPWKNANEHMDHWKVAGFNACRSEILSRLSSEVA